MNSSFRTTLAVTALTIAGLAHADDTTRATWARVVASQPVYRQVAVAVPRQECQQEIVTQPAYGGGSGVGGALLGGLVGGVVGHQFGGGSGNVLATAGGAVLGASVGANLAQRQVPPSQTQREVCRTITDYRDEQQLAGYDVTYVYGGQRYHTHLANDPDRACG
jgi:Predicted outer membrane lipoprotein